MPETQGQLYVETVLIQHSGEMAMIRKVGRRVINMGLHFEPPIEEKNSKSG